MKQKQTRNASERQSLTAPSTVYKRLAPQQDANPLDLFVFFSSFSTDQLWNKRQQQKRHGKTTIDFVSKNISVADEGYQGYLQQNCCGAS